MSFAFVICCIIDIIIGIIALSSEMYLSRHYYIPPVLFLVNTQNTLLKSYTIIKVTVSLLYITQN